ncbi:MAG: hypothetical protein WBB82_05280 [Limnothrix sp.]
MSDSLPISIEPFNWSDLDLEQTFRLVDKYIPLKICRTYAILPLKFQNQCLTLGIVDPDHSGVQLVLKKLLARKRFALLGQKLDAKTYQLLLSSYLNYQNTSALPSIQNTVNLNNSSLEHSKKDIPHSEKPTFVVEEDVPYDSQLALSTVPPEVSAELANDDKKTIVFEGDITELQPKTNHYTGSSNARLNEAQLKSNGNKNNVHSVLVPNSPVQLRNSQRSPIQNNNQQELHLQPQYLHQPLDNLSTLPADQLWNELLGRVLAEGIGRLYFENHDTEGRILFSENGVMKGALFGLPIAKFCGVLNKFKQLAHMPPVPVLQTKKAELEQYYRNERILLRLTVIPGKYGEEGTLQVLRGQALIFHQQKQMDEQGQEALQLAHRLERKLRHIYLRSQINPSPLTAIEDLLICCDRIQNQLDKLQPLD